MIQLEDVSKSFGTRQLLRSVTFDVPNGCITTLLGANGVGKTTTLRIITGLMAPSGGSVLVDGFDVARESLQSRARLGVLPDQFGLYPRLTAREHIEFFARLRGLHGDELATRVRDVERALGIAAFAATAGRHLSQGQSMRVAAARALVGDPQNVIMDEPMRGLDLFGIQLMRRLLQDLRAQGRAVLVTNHSLAEVESLSDRVLVLADGQTVGGGTVGELNALAGTSSLEESFVALSTRAQVAT